MQQTERFVKGALILSAAGIIAKFVSVFYKIPLSQLVGDEGIGYYQMIFPIFSLLIAAGLNGIPNALSKLIAEEIAIGNVKEAQKTFRDTMRISVIVGVAVSLLMILGADATITYTGWSEGTKYVIWGFAISPVFVFITGALKGYFQGFQVMLPTAVSQIIENFIKVIIGISLVIILLGQGTAIAVGGAAIGTSFGFIISAGYMLWNYKKQHVRLEAAIPEANKDWVVYTFTQQMVRIFKIAIPVSIAAAVFSIMNSIDSFTLFHSLAQIGYDKTYATEIIGKMGNSFSVINFPLAISVALSISIIPAISEAVATKDEAALREKIQQGLKLAIMLALPAAVGLFMLAEPIMQMLYSKSPGAYVYLQAYSICLIFMIVGQMLAGILQGVSRQNVPLIALGVAIVVKIVLNYVLVPTALKGIGAAVASIIYYIVILVINYIFLKRTVTFQLDIMKVLIKPLFATGIMMVIVYFTFPGLVALMGGSSGFVNAIATLITVIAGVIFYFGILLITKTFTVEELSLLPKHQKIIAFLQKKKLIK